MHRYFTSVEQQVNWEQCSTALLRKTRNYLLIFTQTDALDTLTRKWNGCLK